MRDDRVRTKIVKDEKKRKRIKILIKRDLNKYFMSDCAKVIQRCKKEVKILKCIFSVKMCDYKSRQSSIQKNG
jgi:hypothetical protein